MNETAMPKTAAEAIREGLQSIETKVDTLLMGSIPALVLDPALETALKTLQGGVSQLVETDSARREEMEFLADLRTKMIEALTILHEQLVTLAHEVKMLRIPPAQKPTLTSWKQWRTYLPWSGGLVAGVVLMGVAWFVWPATSREAFAVDIHAVLQKTYGQLPKGTQDQIRAVYRQYNFLEPGQR